MVKTQVVSFQLYVASRHVSLQIVEQHFKMLDFHNRWHSWFYSFFLKKKKKNTLQFYYKPRILDLQRGIIAIMHFSYLKFICMI